MVGVKWLECEHKNWPASGAEAKSEWSYMLSRSVTLNVMHRENCTFHVLSFHCLYLICNCMKTYDTANNVISIVTRLWTG